jgi:hypothetical protein
MAVKLALLLLLAIYPPKPDMSLSWKDMSVSQALSALKLFAGVALEFNDLNGKPVRFTGRLMSVKAQIRGRVITAQIEGGVIDGDPLRGIPPIELKEAAAVYNRKTGMYYLKAWLFGGLVTLEGKY